jgi:hypothetical protein
MPSSIVIWRSIPGVSRVVDHESSGWTRPLIEKPAAPSDDIGETPVGGLAQSST